MLVALGHLKGARKQKTVEKPDKKGIGRTSIAKGAHCGKVLAALCMEKVLDAYGHGKGLTEKEKGLECRHELVAGP